MQSISKEIRQGRLKYQNKIIERLEYCLNKGADIDHLCFDLNSANSVGTILHYGICKGYTRVVKKALSRGASIAIKSTGDSNHRNAFELAIMVYNDGKLTIRPILEMLKKKILKSYSSYGLTALHLDFAIGTVDKVIFDLIDKTRIGQHPATLVNATVSADSPLWSGMTPLLIADKFENKELLKRLLDFLDEGGKMETLSDDIRRRRVTDETKIIIRLENCLNNGGDIDHLGFPQNRCGNSSGTILHYAIYNGHKRVVKHALSRGASIAIKRTGDSIKYRNALELAIMRYEYDEPPLRPIFKMVKNQILKSYSAYGWTALHVDCAVDEELLLQGHHDHTARVNATVSNESPLWPGVTPLLVAATFGQVRKARRLLDLGADPRVLYRDGDTNDKRLFAFDELSFVFDNKNTLLSSRTGESHFHIALRYCPQALKIVKRYLDRGVSPDLPTQKGTVPLRVAAESNCPDLIRLLLEYGADVGKGYSSKICRSVECSCFCMEAGLDTERVDHEELSRRLTKSTTNGKRDFVKCVLRLNALSAGEDSVSEHLTSLYVRLSNEVKSSWDETEYVGQCAEEATALSDLGLRHLLTATIVKSDFKRKFGWLKSFDFPAYPIYGSLLKMRIKRMFLEYEDKAEKIPVAIPRIQILFQSLCYLPHLCAEKILWNLSGNELARLLQV